MTNSVDTKEVFKRICKNGINKAKHFNFCEVNLVKGKVSHIVKFVLCDSNWKNPHEISVRFIKDEYNTINENMEEFVKYTENFSKK